MKMILATILLFASAAHADMISVHCGKPATKGGEAPVVLGSESIDPGPNEYKYAGLGYRGKEMDLASLNAVKTKGEVTGYKATTKARQGFDIPHLVFEFKGIGNCEESRVGSVTVTSVGGLAGTRVKEVIKGCVCHVD